jgi:hypothetical protein
MPAEVQLTDVPADTGTTTGTGLSAAEAREQNCYLTTTGRVSGRQHEIEIWFAVDPERDGTLYLLAGGRDRSDWVRNVRQNPAVRVRAGATTYLGAGRWIGEASDEDARARDIVATKYGERDADGELNEWARTSLPVAIELADTLEG